MSKLSDVIFNVGVKVFKVKEPQGKVVAMANIVFRMGSTEKFVVTGLRVIDGKKGLFVSMPNFKSPAGIYTDVAFPVTKEFREEIIEDVLAEYEEVK